MRRPGGGRQLLRNKLLTVADELSALGGAELAQLRIIEGLAASGWFIALLHGSRGNLWPRWKACASNARPVAASRSDGASSLHRVHRTLGLAAGVMRSDAQVLYLHNPGDLPAALTGSLTTRVPIALHLHLPPPIRQPKWLNYLLRKADAVIAPSGDTADRWRKESELSASRITVIPTGVDTDHFVPLSKADRDEQRRLLGLEPDVPIVLFAGRLHHTKGLYALLEGMGRMKEQANLVICGAGADATYVDVLHRDAAEMRITWLDWRPDISALLATADLLVLPSLFDEPQGMVVSEAMSCGTPAVASSVGGLPESLAAFPDHLVPPGDPDALAASMDRVVGWRRLAPTLGNDCREWVLQHLTLRRSVEAVSHLLADVGR